jgi:hypothetical protein
VDASPLPEPALESGCLASEPRKELLSRTVGAQIATGARVQSQSDYQAVVVHGKPINHVLHLVLSFVTVFMWTPVWVCLAIFGGEKRSMITVDEYGNVAIQKV